MVDRDANRALLGAYRNNVVRYTKLLNAHLTDIERRYVMGRLSAYLAAVEALDGNHFPENDTGTHRGALHQGSCRA